MKIELRGKNHDRHIATYNCTVLLKTRSLTSRLNVDYMVRSGSFETGGAREPEGNPADPDSPAKMTDKWK